MVKRKQGKNYCLKFMDFKNSLLKSEFPKFCITFKCVRKKYWARPTRTAPKKAKQEINDLLDDDHYLHL